MSRAWATGRGPRGAGVRLAAAVSAAWGVAGCVSDGDRERPSPPPDTATVAHVAIALSVGDFVDTDRNGYRDTSAAMVYLFDASGGSALPIRADGPVRFAAIDPAGRELAAWSFDGPAVEAARVHTPVGTGYRFVLDFRTTGTDRISAGDATVACTMTRPERGPVSQHTQSRVAVGRVP